MNIPLGISLSTSYDDGEWLLSPYLDIGAKLNLGDDKLDGTAHWGGVDNLAADTATEFIDPLAFTADFGLSVQHQGFKVLAGAGFVGSENSRSLALTLQAQLKF